MPSLLDKAYDPNRVEDRIYDFGLKGTTLAPVPIPIKSPIPL